MPLCQDSLITALYTAAGPVAIYRRPYCAGPACLLSVAEVLWGQAMTVRRGCGPSRLVAWRPRNELGGDLPKCQIDMPQSPCSDAPLTTTSLSLATGPRISLPTDLAFKW